MTELAKSPEERRSRAAGPSAIVPAEGRAPDGWRRGKPEEDPEKMKRWGLVAAKPSEFLIHMRGGTVRTQGQGASCFKWPHDSVAVIPTTIQRLQFTADQVTGEKVGVRVTGVAVYRIAEPLIAFRMLNFSFPERAQEKLSQMLEEMFVGATRRLVANLTVEQCLTRRKDALSTELMKEIAPVVSGHGRTDDRTRSGWGVVLDSIEIQDVRVLSPAVFATMQARFRHDQERLAREAELARDRAVKQDEANTERQIALTRLSSQTEVRRQQQAAQELAQLEQLAAEARVEESRKARARADQQEALEAQRAHELQKLAGEVEVRQQKGLADEAARLEALAAEARVAQARLKAQAEGVAALEAAKLEAVQAEARLSQARLAAEVERAQLEARKQLALHAAKLAAEAHAQELLEAQAQVAQARQQVAQIEVQTFELELRKAALEQALELDRLAQVRNVENTLTPEAISMAVAQKLPELAAAFQQKMGEVHVTAVDGANPFGYIASAVQGVLGLARSAGLQVPASAPPSASP